MPLRPSFPMLAPRKPAPGMGVDWSNEITTGLKLAMPFTEGGGQYVNDYSGAAPTTPGFLGNSGNLTGGVTWVPGNFGGQCLSFNGSTGCINILDAPSQRPAAVTVLAWVKHKMASGSVGRVVAKPQVAASKQAYSLNVCVTGTTVDFRIQPSSGTVSLQGTSATNDGKWHFIGGGYDPTSFMKVWFDGRRENSSVSTSSNTIGYFNLLPLQIGRFDSGGAQYYNGQLDLVTIIGRLLTDTEVLALYLNTAPVYLQPSWQSLDLLPVASVADTFPAYCGKQYVYEEEFEEITY